MIETVVGMLATTSMEALWPSCSPDFGVNGVLDRFSQIKSKVPIAADGYFHKGKTISNLEKVTQIGQQIESIKTIIVPFANLADAATISTTAKAELWQNTLNRYCLTLSILCNCPLTTLFIFHIRPGQQVFPNVVFIRLEEH